jgi:hypothetical protein
MMIHTCYDIPFDDVGKIMTKHGMKYLYGSFIYAGQMFLETREPIPLINCSYEMDAANDKIKFWHTKDSGNG